MQIRSNIQAQAAAAAGLALAANAFIWLTNPAAIISHGRVSLEPPGYVIGIVWLVLFVCMGIARSIAVDHRKLLLLLILSCAAYPLYTLGLRSVLLGFVGNVATLAFALVAAQRTWPGAPKATLLIAPVIAWLSFASFLTLEQMRRGL